MGRTVGPAAGIFLAFLATLNVGRVLHHAMWRDEMQAFLLAAGSPTPGVLLERLHYESHPGLWHALLWLLTRVTSDPMWMQVMHVVIALGVWWLVVRYAPFGAAEKVLLLAGYFLFWEYFVLSRCYALMALLGFGFVVVRTAWPAATARAWLLLGLLANTSLYGAIWSIAMGIVFAVETGAPRRIMPAMLGWVGLVGLAVVTMRPAPDQAFHDSSFHSDAARLLAVVAVPVGALLPVRPAWLRAGLEYAIASDATPPPPFWDPNPTPAIAGRLALDASHPFRVAAALLAPLALGWLVVRDRMRVAELAIGFVGVMLFAYLWAFPGASRHQGVLFLMVVAAAWRVRAARPFGGIATAVWWLLLLAGATGGVGTLASEVRPFSQGQRVAAWLTAQHAEDALVIGSADFAASTVAGYWGRPLYYPECECEGTFIEWSTRRVMHLEPAELARRVARAAAQAGPRDVLLVLNRALAPDELAAGVPALDATLLQAFEGAVVPNENFFVYRLTPGAGADAEHHG